MKDKQTESMNLLSGQQPVGMEKRIYYSVIINKK